MFTKKNINPRRYRNRFLIRNGNHIGIYRYIDGWMLLVIPLTKKPITIAESEGYDLVHKVYDSFDDKVANTLLKYTCHEPSNTIQDLVMVSEIYPLPAYVNLKVDYDVEAIKYAINSDNDFYETLLDIIINKKIHI